MIDIATASVCRKTLRRPASKIKFSDMRGEFGFSGAIAEEKQYLQSGLRPENREIFSNPQISSYAMKILRFSLQVSKSLF